MTKKPRILVVDDETQILDLLRDALTDAGYVVDSAESAQAALGLVKDNLYDVDHWHVTQVFGGAWV